MHTIIIAAACALSAGAVRNGLASELPESLSTLRQGGGMNIVVPTDYGREVSLQLDTSYTTQTLGELLTTTQIEKLDTIRREAPEKFALIAQLYPHYAAEYFLRTRTPAAAPATAQEAVPTTVVVSPRSISTPSQVSQPPVVAAEARTPDFLSPQKNNAFLALRKQYSPYRSPTMSMVGDTLSIDGRIITEKLHADAAAAGMPPEDFAEGFYNRICRALARQRAGDLRDVVSAQSMLNFLKDARLAAFSPEEKQIVFQRVFRRDLRGVAEQAQQEAEKMDGSASLLQIGLIQ